MLASGSCHRGHPRGPPRLSRGGGCLLAVPTLLLLLILGLRAAVCQGQGQDYDNEEGFQGSQEYNGDEGAVSGNPEDQGSGEGREGQFFFGRGIFGPPISHPGLFGPQYPQSPLSPVPYVSHYIRNAFMPQMSPYSGFPNYGYNNIYNNGYFNQPFMQRYRRALAQGSGSSEGSIPYLKDDEDDDDDEGDDDDNDDDVLDKIRQEEQVKAFRDMVTIAASSASKTEPDLHHEDEDDDDENDDEERESKVLVPMGLQDQQKQQSGRQRRFVNPLVLLGGMKLAELVSGGGASSFGYQTSGGPGRSNYFNDNSAGIVPADYGQSYFNDNSPGITPADYGQSYFDEASPSITPVPDPYLNGGAY